MNSIILQLESVGYTPLIPLNDKIPARPGWRNQRITDLSDFRSVNNVGLILGSINNFVDIDIDCDEALLLADFFLPATNAVFGRKSRPMSHRLYTVTDAFFETIQLRHKTLGTVIELRGEGAQTRIPPSTDGETKEEITFVKGFDYEPPTRATYAELKRAIVQLAVAAVLRPHWNSGNRHACCLALSGVLLNAHWKENDALDFVSRLVEAFHDPDRNDRLQCVTSTFDTNAPVSGHTKLVEEIGSDDAAAIARWLGTSCPALKSPTGSFKYLKTQADFAEYFAERRRDVLFYSDLRDSWFKKCSGIFDLIGEIEVQREVLRFLEELEPDFGRQVDQFKTASGLQNLVKLARLYLQAPTEVFDADAYLLGCKNGILNLDTGSLCEEISAIVTKRTGTNFDPDAKCPKFESFLDDILCDSPELKSYVQRWMGYTLSGSTQEHCLAICIGSGRNGKSTLMDVMGALMGGYAGALPMAALMESRFG